MEDNYDIAIIGSGPGGYVTAIRAAQLGFKVVCIDKNKNLGGTCLNVGCIPSKCLLHSTELYHVLKTSGKEHGIDGKDLTVNFPDMMKRKNKVVESLVQGINGLFDRHGVVSLYGTASFIDPHTLQISQDTYSKKIIAKNIIIATGSQSIELPTLPFDEKQILSSTGALSLKSIPERLVVVGGGVIGVELASVYARIGSDVTVVEMLNTICPTLDEFIQKNFLKILTKQNIKFLLSAKVLSAVKQPDEVILTIEHQEKLINLAATKVLVAIGRKAFTEGLNLKGVGIETDKRGFIQVDTNLQTIHPHIFAIGDTVEGMLLAHRASEEGIAVVERLAGQNSVINYIAIPNVIYTSPEVASVGLTEEEAKESGLEIIVGTFFFKGNPRARCNGETEGVVKIIGEKKSGRLIGLHIIGNQASELIEIGMVGIEKKMTLHEIAHSPFAHPTLSETIKEAALAALGGAIHA